MSLSPSAATRLLLVLAACAIPGLALPARAAVSPPGTNLRWDKCYGDNGALNKDFACDTNLGAERLIGSFELAAPIANISGIEMFVDLASVSAAYPVWWQLKNAGSCRAASIGMTTVPPVDAVNCVDWASGSGGSAGGIGAYQLGSNGINHARLLMAAAVPASALASLDVGQEYFAFAVTINHAKTIGTGACAGCLEPMCIFFSGARLDTPGIVGPVVSLTRGANYAGSQYVTWQRGYPTNVITGGCGGQTGGVIFCQYLQTSFDCVLYSVTQSRGSTWGAVKSLYR